MAYGFIAFFVSMLLGIPIGFSLGVGSVAALLAKGYNIGVIAVRMFTGIDSFPIMAIPFFVLAGELMNQTGITNRLVKFSDVLVGHLKGGLAHVNIVASMFFAGITGSAVADTSAIGSMLIPAMVEQGFDLDFSAAVTASSSVIGPIIPPSIPFVVYALITGTSVGALFLAGVIPGILLGLGLMIPAYIISVKRDYPSNPRATLREVFHAFVKALVPLMMPIIILGGILTGVFTATEASSVAVVYSLVIGFLVYRNLKPEHLPKILVRTAKTTATVFIVMACANAFNWLMATEQVPQYLAKLLTSGISSKAMILLLINLVLLFLGCFMEGTAAMIITVPTLLAIAKAVGISPVHLGSIVVLNLMIGLITPPLGLCLFIACSISKLSLEKLSKAILPFLAVEIAVLVLVTYVEPVSMFLPRLLGFVR